MQLEQYQMLFIDRLVEHSQFRRLFPARVEFVLSVSDEGLWRGFVLEKFGYRGRKTRIFRKYYGEKAEVTIWNVSYYSVVRYMEARLD